MKAMIFAAGMGTRLRPLTDNKPKALVEVNGKTLLERCILNLKKYGIRKIIVNIHHFGDQMINYLSNNNFGVEILVSDERENLMETGGALLKAKNLLKGDDQILLINVDIFTNLNFNELLNFHLKNKSLATLVVRQRKSSRFFLVNHGNLLCGWYNDNTGETKISRPDEINNTKKLAFSGIHIINPELLDLIEEQGKFPIIELYLRLAENHSIYVFNDGHSEWMDLGNYDKFKFAEEFLRNLS